MMIYQKLTKMTIIGLCCALGNLLILIVRPLCPPFVKTMMFGEAVHFPWTFQMGMWLPFFMGVGIIIHRYLMSVESHRFYRESCPPVAESVILDTKHFVHWMDSLRPLARRPTAIASQVLLQVILKYQASKSVEQASGMLSSLLELCRQKLDLDYSSIRYLSWLIPSLGFMGTVYGISLAVDVVGKSSPDDPALLQMVALNLAIAFNTTLLALIQAAILIYFTSIVENKEEGFLNRIGEYVLEHVINRLH